MSLIPQSGKAAMQRVKRPPVRNKIDLVDPAQVRAWTRRLGVSVDVLRAVVDKAGNSVAAVTKEVELQRAANQTTSHPVAPAHQVAPSPPIQSPTTEGELPAPI
jgi:hypothetical protein